MKFHGRNNLTTFISVTAFFLPFFISACGQKEEEKIVITIQTDMPEAEVNPSPAPPPSPVSSPRPAETGKSGDKPPVVAQSPRSSSPPSRPITPSRQAPEGAPLEPSQAPSNQEASLRPVATPELPEGAFKPKSDEEKIRAIIRQQEVGMETGDLDLLYAGLASITPDTQKQLEDFFESYTDVDVENEIERIEVKGDAAEVVMDWATRVVIKRSKKKSESNNKVLWKFIKQGGDWKIKETKVIEKLKP